MKPLTLVIALLFAANLFAQPDQWAVAIDPAEEQSLRDSKECVFMTRVVSDNTITVDGEIDDQWSHVVMSEYKTFIKYATAYENGAYVKKSMLEDGGNTRRVSSGPEDFSGKYGFLFDDDYFFILFDIVDDEVNDGVLNPGTTETLELQEAPYAYEAQDVLRGAPYPPYTGTGHIGSAGAKDRNLKYCYWGYLGAFLINFELGADGKCEASIRQKADALAKINYEQRQAACLCAWKPRTDGKSGYIAEVGISFKVTLADSANNPFSLPYLNDEIKQIAFEMKVIDRDLGKKDCQASWKTENNNVWDAMLWCSKLIISPPWYVYKSLNCGEFQGNHLTTTLSPRFSPNPASTHINFEESISLIEIYSLEGRLQIKQQHTNTVNVSTLPSGMYVVKGDGMVLGKMVKV